MSRGSTTGPTVDRVRPRASGMSPSTPTQEHPRNRPPRASGDEPWSESPRPSTPPSAPREGMSPPVKAPGQDGDVRPRERDEPSPNWTDTLTEGRPPRASGDEPSPSGPTPHRGRPPRASGDEPRAYAVTQVSVESAPARAGMSHRRWHVSATLENEADATLENEATGSCCLVCRVLGSHAGQGVDSAVA